MAKKEKFDYFVALEKIADYACEEAKALSKIVCEYNPSEIRQRMDAVHEIENASDTINHDIYNNLATEFVTPIDRDDILMLAQTLDEIVDKIEDVVMRMYMFNIQSMLPLAFEMCSLIEKGTNALRIALADFKNFKKSQSLRQLLIDVSDYEEEADVVYIKAIRRLHVDAELSAVDVYSWTELFTYMEKCCDACSHVADIMSTVIMKNS